MTNNFYQFKANSLQGKVVGMEEFKGVILFATHDHPGGKYCQQMWLHPPV